MFLRGAPTAASVFATLASIMAIKVYLDGAIVAPEDARISVFDRGFLYGDSIYEVMRTSAGHPVDIDAHLDRLARSGERIALDVPDREVTRSAIAKTLAASGNDESYVRVIFTRGGGEIGLDTALAETPRLLVIVKPLTLLPPQAYERGIMLRIVGVERMSPRAMDPAVKSGNYLNNILALHEAKRAGADEALMCDSQGRVTEGSTCNVFIVRDGALFTPALHIGLLAGITRMRVIELTRPHFPVYETALTPEDIRSAPEVFITSSIRGVVPVARVDEELIGAGAPGPVTSRIMALYQAYLDSYAEKS